MTPSPLDHFFSVDKPHLHNQRVRHHKTRFLLLLCSVVAILSAAAWAVRS